MNLDFQDLGAGGVGGLGLAPVDPVRPLVADVKGRGLPESAHHGIGKGRVIGGLQRQTLMQRSPR